MREVEAEALTMAIEEMIIAYIAATVHMNHRHDTLSKARNRLIEQLTKEP